MDGNLKYSKYSDELTHFLNLELITIYKRGDYKLARKHIRKMSKWKLLDFIGIAQNNGCPTALDNRRIRIT